MNGITYWASCVTCAHLEDHRDVLGFFTRDDRDEWATKHTTGNGHIVELWDKQPAFPVPSTLN